MVASFRIRPFRTYARCPQSTLALRRAPAHAQARRRNHRRGSRGGVDEQLFDAIYQAFLRYQVLLFGTQDLPPGRQVEFARRFGEVQIHVMNQYHIDGYPELYRLSNLDEQGNPNGRHPDKGTLAWHTDGSWRRVTGQATIMYAEMSPERGGETHFCDMYGAYERLSPEWKARIANLRAVHNLDFSRNRRHGEEPMTEAQRHAVPPVDHPIVRTHPETGRKCVFLGDHAEYIARHGLRRRAAR